MNIIARSSGILLHISSLPGPSGIGDLGRDAYNFVDWLSAAGQSWWQVLPVNPAGVANSPYMATSAFAGSPLFVDIAELRERGWLGPGEGVKIPPGISRRVDYAAVEEQKKKLFCVASQRFFGNTSDPLRASFDTFVKEHSSWVLDYALFAALNDAHGRSAWTTWPADLVHRSAKAIESARAQYHTEIDQHLFVQWCFHRQWNTLRSYARSKGVRLMGDLPIFVAHQSADVWVNQDLFLLDGEGRSTFVAGVPPDYFSETGQRWGNPLYDWKAMEKEKYRWWKERLRAAMELFDMTRIDHFRGFEAYWTIPASEKTAVNGSWTKGPGTAFFRAMKRALGALPIVAEDLGVITPEVVDMREAFDLPGMKVLQFAFAGGPENSFLPHNHTTNAVVYTGTHDNDTSRGWYDQATEHERDFLRRYFQTDGHDVHWTMIHAAEQSSASIAIVPMQDVLGLGSSDRMNTPGTTRGNWEWRFTWDQVQPFHAQKMYEMSAMSGRCVADRLSFVPFPENKRRP